MELQKGSKYLIKERCIPIFTSGGLISYKSELKEIEILEVTKEAYKIYNCLTWETYWKPKTWAFEIVEKIEDN